MSESLTQGRVWGARATVAFGAGILVVYAIAQALGALVVALWKARNGTPGLREFGGILEDNFGLILAVSIFLSTILCLGLIGGIIKLRGAAIADYLGLSRVTGKRLLVATGITVGYVAATDGLTVILGRPLVPEFMLDAIDSGVSPLLLGTAVIVFAPAFEEAFFRGFLFAGFRESRLGVYGSIVLVSLVWTVIHVQYGAYELAIIFVFGILLGIARFRTGSLWTPFVMHALTNLIATVEATLKASGVL